MQWSDYRKLTAPQLRGRKVRIKWAVRNSLIEIPAGTICTVTDKWAGLELKIDPCPHCGLKAFITRVNPLHVDLLDEESCSAC